MRHQALLDDVASQRFLLRRNTHRLEKGLLMRPRRTVFAVDYIAETVRAFEVVASAVRADELDSLSSDRDWAGDVLGEYFAVVGSHPTVDRARSRFARVTRPPAAERKIPYRRCLATEPGLTYDALAALARQRRSVRWFRQEPVDRELVDRALLVGLQAPSACNRQPFEFRIFDEPELVRSIVDLPRGTPGYAHNIPMIIVVVGQLRAFFHERDRHLIYIDASLASMGFMLALETLGLSSCPINWPDVEPLERQMAELLGLEPDERVVLLIAVGAPDDEGLVAFSQKRPLDDIRRYNQAARS